MPIFFKKKYPYLIAEVGSNHAGSLSIAKSAIINAKKSGADCIKFQWYKAETIVHPSMKVMTHIKKKKERTQYQRFKKLELNEKKTFDLYKLSKQTNIDFAVTPFDSSFIKFLSKYVTFFKIASGDVDYIPLLEEIAKYNKPVVLSTGMSNINRIKIATKILNQNKLILLHCISSYPTKESEANLNSIRYLQDKFNLEVGLSDHTSGFASAVMSLSFGVRIIEKHFLPNNKIKNVGDYKLSLNPQRFNKFRELINNSYSGLGKYEKKIFKSEKKFIKPLRRSLYFKDNFSKGHKIKKSDICFIRPYNSNALAPENYKTIIGKKLKKNIKKLTLIKNKYFK